MKESQIRQRIRLKIGGRKDVILLSNPSGMGVVGDIQKFRPGAASTTVYNPRYLSFGLGARPGKRGGEFPDFIGGQTVKITPEMVGTEVCVWIAIEVKQDGKHATAGQLEKIALLNSFGARAGVAHSAEEAEEILL